MKKPLLLLTLLTFIAGCARLPFVYRSDVQQGNLISEAAVKQIKPGMPSDQVRYLMGTPVLTNVFNPNRWDYVYTYQPGQGEMQIKRVTIHFVNDVVQNVSESY